MKILVIIPCYNEEKNIVNTVNDLKKVNVDYIVNDKNIDKIFVIGRFRYDVMTRLEFAGIDKDKIVLIDELDTLIKKVKKNSVGDIYTMVCFDMTANIHKLIEDDENEKI